MVIGGGPGPRSLAGMRNLSSKRPQPLAVRLLHWVQIPLLVVMAGSGLQILIAYPYLGPQGEPWAGYPFQGWRPPDLLRIGSWLAGARHWHFAFLWPLVALGGAYVAWLGFTGEWRRRLFNPKRDTPSLLRTAAAYLRFRKLPVGHELYNGLQRLAYTAVLLVAIAQVLSGLVLYKPVQLRALGLLIGGYEGARIIHLYGLGFLAFFTVGHVVMVLLHPASLREMITGGKPRE